MAKRKVARKSFVKIHEISRVRARAYTRFWITFYVGSILIFCGNICYHKTALRTTCTRTLGQFKTLLSVCIRMFLQKITQFSCKITNIPLLCSPSSSTVKQRILGHPGDCAGRCPVAREGQRGAAGTRAEAGGQPEQAGAAAPCQRGRQAEALDLLSGVFEWIFEQHEPALGARAPQSPRGAGYRRRDANFVRAQVRHVSLSDAVVNVLLNLK